MAQILYIACSSYSGSTLLAFLLNTHPDIVSVGHMTGWDTGIAGRYVRCSCGRVLNECPFFQRIHDAFREQGQPFDYNEFGTHYRLAQSDRLNRYLTAGLPFQRSALERSRDALVHLVPSFAARLAEQDRTNLTFINAALSYAGAKVFVDNSRTIHRLRHLRRITELDVATLHLIRDFRGVALSNMTKRGWKPVVAAKHWLKQQMEIVRVVEESSRTIRVYYEDLCDSTNDTLEGIHKFLGLPPHSFCGDYKDVEHHVLGNVMRARPSTITRDTRWQRDLAARDRALITQTAGQFMRRHRSHPVSEIIEHYLGLYPDYEPGGGDAVVDRESERVKVEP